MSLSTGERGSDIRRPPRLSTRAFLSELADELFSLDRGLPWSLGQLLRRPGAAIRAYVIDREPRMTRPVRLVLVLLALAALAAHLSGVADEFGSGMAAAQADHESRASTDSVVPLALNMLMQRFDLMLVICWVPAIAAAVRRCYRAAGLNMAESVVFAMYTLALMLLLQLPVLADLLPDVVGRWYALAALVWPVLGASHGFFQADGFDAWRAPACLLTAVFFLLVMLTGALMFHVLWLLYAV